MRVDPKSIVRRLNPTCTACLQGAVEDAAASRHYEVCIEHVMARLADAEKSDVEGILRHFGTDRLRLRSAVARTLETMRNGNPGKPVFAENLFTWFENAWMVASLERSATRLRTGDLLLELVTAPRRYCPDPFEELDVVEPVGLRATFGDIVAGSSEDQDVAASASGMASAGSTAVVGHEALERFTISFTDRARRDEIDPIFGRDREVRQVVDVLVRRRKNNPIVVGDPGVGKTALVEGLALAIARGEVPVELAGVDLRALDLGLLKAGAGVRGELEDRLKRVIAEVKASPTPIIMFIDEAHTLLGGGDGDLSNLLKPALARGEFRTVAATTWREYKKYFEKDPALERRFQPIAVDEPSVEDALVMLRGLRETYETAHRIKIRDEALRAAVALSDRFISGRKLPDKAVDLLDTAAARVKIEQAAPAATVIALESERAALAREVAARTRDLDEGCVGDRAPVDVLCDRMHAIDVELAALATRRDEERAAIDRVRGAEDALRGASDERRTDALANVKHLREQLAAVQGDDPLCHHEVDRDAISRVVSDWTGIPVGKMNSSSIEVMLDLESRMRRRIKGQDDATAAVAEAVRMSHAGVRDPNAPVAVLLFVGPSGVGKTETALALADLLYGGERQMITTNMSEFQERHSVSRLVGSPPGYVGFGEGGLLTEAVRQRPYSVVLLDECEKADLEVMNLFYQVFDKGTLADGEGRVVNFRNTLVILTSNLATEMIMELNAGAQCPPTAEIVAAIRPVLSDHFKPALLARMSIVPFRPMERDILGEIARLKLAALANRLRAAHGVETTFDTALVAALVARCCEAETGARALDHAMRGSLMPNLARVLLEQMAGGEVPPDLRVGLHDDGAWRFEFGERRAAGS